MDAPYDGPGKRRLPPSTDAVLHWDELNQEQLSSLAKDPTFGPKLALLQNAENWLENQGSSGQAGCPSSDELYDFGRGPGFRPLPEEREDAIARHVKHCEDCNIFVSTLDANPPVPLELSPAQETPVLAGPRPLRWRLLAPLAAAAAVMAITILSINDGASEGVIAGLPTGYPEAPLLRGGETSQMLLFPRGKVLERGGVSFANSTNSIGDLDWARTITFEIAGVAPGADEYAIEIFRHDGSAFERGASIARLSGAESVLETDEALARSLTPGHYTWEAWVTENGLNRRLGALDFEVVDAQENWAAVTGVEKVDSRCVRWLHEAGFLSEARALAQSLPESPGRQAYLSAIPGR